MAPLGIVLRAAPLQALLRPPFRKVYARATWSIYVVQVSAAADNLFQGVQSTLHRTIPAGASASDLSR
eukprot:6208699-Pleurochrysis_carterae.AAC.2